VKKNFLLCFLVLEPELILDDVLAEKEKAKKEKTFEKFVDNTTGKFK
jgi:hypothetical protein